MGLSQRHWAVPQSLEIRKKGPKRAAMAPPVAWWAILVPSKTNYVGSILTKVQRIREGVFVAEEREGVS